MRKNQNESAREGDELITPTITAAEVYQQMKADKLRLKS